MKIKLAKQTKIVVQPEEAIEMPVAEDSAVVKALSAAAGEAIKAKLK